jgi:hypothetical protein
MQVEQRTQIKRIQMKYRIFLNFRKRLKLDITYEIKHCSELVVSPQFPLTHYNDILLLVICNGDETPIGSLNKILFLHIL